jgi:catechol 2,3-dioxygenase-like lactoylglutathione lyase family enzyme
LPNVLERLAGEGASRGESRVMTAVHSLDHYALSVPDASAGIEFYRDFGLTPLPSGRSVRLDAQNGVAALLYEGARKRLHHLTFGIDAAAMPGLAQRLQSQGVALVDAPRELEGEDGSGVWFRDPDGNLVQVAVTSRRSPAQKSHMSVRTAADGERGAPDAAGDIRPQRLGHVLLFTPDVLGSIAFYERALGLRLSDRSGEIVAFMHTPLGSDHHILAFGKSDRPGFHHGSFELDSIDKIGMAAMRMSEKGYREGWGFGRHYIGSNYFQYVRDPWGSFAEYFCDIDFIPAGGTWEARDVPPERALFVWGPPPPPYFFLNAESD